MNKIFLFILFIFVTFDFSKGETKNNVINIDSNICPYLETNVDCDSLLQKWKEDSCGCLNFRRPQMMYSIIEEMKIQEIDIDSFVSIFGNANQVISYGDKKCLIYYFNSVCLDNRFLKLPEGYCQIEVVFYDVKPKYEIQAICY